MIERYFPFINDCHTVRRYSMHKLDLHSTKYLVTAKQPYSLKKRQLKYLELTSGLHHNAPVTITHIVPNDVYLYNGTDDVLNLLLNAKNRPSTVSANVIEIDYSRLASEITVGQLDGKLQAWKSVGPASTKQDLVTDKYIQDALVEEVSDISHDMEYMQESIMNEDDLADLMTGITTGSVQQVVSKEPPFFTMIRNYLSSNTATEKIPLLVGMSGIAKSAMVKSVASEFDMRMVDLRVSFMSRLDIDGLTEIVGEDTGAPFSMNAPMVEFLTCTDEYLDFSKKMITTIKNKLTDTSLDNDDKTELEVVLSKFKESAKIPVLFLDELTRSDKSIRGALTTIINQRIYGKYHLNQARMIAATNCPVGYEDDPDMQDMFIGASMDDVAVLDRFNKIPLAPESVLPVWMDYIEGEGNFHPLVIEYIKKDPSSRAYDETDAVEKARDYDRVDNMIPPYPTFRAWNYVSDYLYTIDDTKIYKPDILDGLLGEHSAESFVQEEMQDYSIKPTTSDPMKDFVSDTLDAGLPAMLMGVSGIGKTTRVRNYCKERGYDFMLVSLATKDRLDIMGPPAKVDITNHISKSSSKILDKLGMSTEINKLKSGAGLPNSVTVRSPKSELKEKILHAVETGKPLVILFDEFNRCADPTVQSAIFQAVEGHFAGVDFPPHLVKVVMAGNISDENTMEAGDVDGALTARAVQYVKPSYTEEDAEAILQYMKDNNFAQSLLDYLNDNTDLVLDLVKSVDEGSLTKNVSSTRSLHALSDALLEDETSPLMHGKILMTDADARQEFNMAGRLDPDVLRSTVNRIVGDLDDWAALSMSDKYKFANGADLATVVKVFKQAVDALNSGRDDAEFMDRLYVITTNLLSVDTQVQTDREQLFGYYVDSDLAEGFTQYYNTVSGRASGQVSIDQLESSDVLPTYIEQQIANYSAVGWYKLILDIWYHHNVKITPDNYVVAILGCMEQFSQDFNRKDALKMLHSAQDLASYLDNDDKLFTSLAIALGYSREDAIKIIQLHASK